MTEYALYIESGPKLRKTMVHVFRLLGCIANGPTTQAAIEATPAAVRAYLRFLRDAGEEAGPDGAIETRVAQHITEGQWLGNGSPYVTFEPDLEPVLEQELDTFIRRRHAMRELLARWAAGLSAGALDAPAEGRTARAILLHVIGPTASYLSPVLGTVAGVSRLQTRAERGEVALADALSQTAALVSERLHDVTAAERARIVQRPKDTRTLRKAIRRMLEHDWEHIAELSRRPGGPAL